MLWCGCSSFLPVLAVSGKNKNPNLRSWGIIKMIIIKMIIIIIMIIIMIMIIMMIMIIIMIIII